MTPPPLTAHDFALPPRAARRSLRDDSRYLRATLGWTLVLYAALALALGGWIAPWWLLPTVPLVYVRLSLAMHELLHLRAGARVPAFHRLAMIFDTPVGLGYREHRAIHLRHHRHSAGALDPELFQIRGGPLRAFIGALLVPELSLWHWLRRRGVSAALARGAALRALCFMTIAALNPPVFLFYWLALRLSIGASGFVFHHLLHQRGGRLGTYALPGTPALFRAGRLLFGEEPMLILQRHRAHHLWPQLRVRDLPDLPPDLALPPGALHDARRSAAALR
jgi:fatty acid desaturase